jgi:hypothetical protein
MELGGRECIPLSLCGTLLSYICSVESACAFVPVAWRRAWASRRGADDAPGSGRPGSGSCRAQPSRAPERPHYDSRCTLTSHISLKFIDQKTKRSTCTIRRSLSILSPSGGLPYRYIRRRLRQGGAMGSTSHARLCGIFPLAPSKRRCRGSRSPGPRPSAALPTLLHLAADCCMLSRASG